MRRVNVVGTSGSGKSTFSAELAKVLGCQHIEMDTLFWLPNWQESSDEVFFSNVERALDCPSWVLDGNYNRTRDTKWRDVDTVIWIDYSFARTLLQAVKRAIHRVWTGQELWPNTGNRETFQKSFCSKDSIIAWTIRTYHSNRVRYLDDMRNPDYQHIHFIRLGSPKECQAFLSQIAQPSCPQ